VAGESGEDAELLLASARGDADAFAVLVRRHIRAATLLAAQLLGDQDDAEDIVQVAFTIVYERARSFDTARPFTPWLYAIVRRLAANKRARDARRARLMTLWGRWSGGVAAPSESKADSVLVAEEEAESMRQEINALSPMQRACFELVALRGISTQEAAAMHGITESTVRQHVFRARQALTRALTSTSH
jgi:RNA polymerase sigma-70 factor, ECF subfamily